MTLVGDAPTDAATIVEFYDYECPFCTRSQPAVRAVMSDPNITFVPRHFPLDFHTAAIPAAIAAECADAQNTFEPYHTLIFEQDQLAGTDWSDLAREAGVGDIGAFDACVAAREPMAKIEADQALALEVGVGVIPTFIINGVIFEGAATEAHLRELAAEIANPLDV